MIPKPGSASLFIALALLCLGLSACDNLVLHQKSKSESPSGTTGTIKISLGASSGSVQKTIIAAAIGKVTVTITDTADSSQHTSKSITGAGGTLSFPGLADGSSWTVSAEMYVGAAMVGTGSAGPLTVHIGSPTSASLHFSFVPALGNLDIWIYWPKSTGANYLAWSFGGYSAEVTAPVLSADGSTYSCELKSPYITAGDHTLSMAFKKNGAGGSPAGTFVEAVQIFSGMSSGTWIDSNGNLHNGMTLSPEDFLDSTASLHSLILSGTDMTADFKSSVTKYSFSSEPGSFHFTLAPGADGQKISYTWGGAAGALTSNADGSKSSGNLAFDTASGGTGSNQLVITVTAPDRSTSAAYTVTDPTVRSAAALVAIANDLSGTYALAEDITIVGSWAPIGTPTSPFTGQFDGMGHTITYDGVSVSSDYSGLFGTTSGAIVTNVNIAGTLSGATGVGGIAGSADNGTISNCVCTATVSGSYFAGGIVGKATYMNIVDCYNSSGSVSTSQNLVGGIAGRATNCNLLHCYSTAPVSGVIDVGGLVGSINDSYVEQCFASGSVYATGDWSGGLTGYNSAGSTIRDSYARGTVNGHTIVGGLAGFNGGVIQGCYATGAVIASSSSGALIGSNWPTGTTVTDSYDNSLGDTYYNDALSAAVPAAWVGAAGVWGWDGSVNGGYPYLMYFKSNTTVYE